MKRIWSAAITAALISGFAAAAPGPALAGKPAASDKIYLLYNYYSPLGDPTTIQQVDVDSNNVLKAETSWSFPGYGRDLMLVAGTPNKLYVSNTNSINIIDLTFPLEDGNNGKSVVGAGLTIPGALGGNMTYYASTKRIYIPFSSTSAPSVVKVFDTVAKSFDDVEFVVPCDAYSTAISPKTKLRTSNKLYVGCFQSPGVYEFSLDNPAAAYRFLPTTEPVWRMDFRNTKLYMASRMYSSTSGGFWYWDPAKPDDPAQVLASGPTGVPLYSANSLAYVPSSTSAGRYLLSGYESYDHAWVFDPAATPPSFYGWSQDPGIGYLGSQAVAAHPRLVNKGFFGMSTPRWGLFSFTMAPGGFPVDSYIWTPWPPAAIAGRAVNK